MHKQLMAALLLGTASLMGGVAFAADAIEPAEPAPIVLPADNPFNGFYAGAHVGYTSASTEESFFAYAPGWDLDYPYGGFAGDFENSLSGASIGVQAGVNYVLDSGLVLGGEVSISWAAIQGETSDFDVDWYCGCDVEGGNFNAQIDALGTGVLKVGYATDKFLVYATAGLALADYSWDDTFGGDSYDGPWFHLASGSGVRQGWTVGVGGSVMVTDSTSIDLQYNYADFGTLDTEDFGEVTTAAADPSSSYTSFYDKSVALTSHTIKIGVNQHF